MAADNIAMAAYLATIMIIPAKNMPATAKSHEHAADKEAEGEHEHTFSICDRHTLS